VHEYVSRAFHLAMSGRPGPVVLALPEDMLTQTASGPDVAPYQVVQASPSAADLERLRELLARSRQPLVILGGTVWTREACRDLQAFAESSGVRGEFRPPDRLLVPLPGPVRQPPRPLRRRRRHRH